MNGDRFQRISLGNIPTLQGLTVQEQKEKLVATIEDCDATIQDSKNHSIVRQAAKALRDRSFLLLTELVKNDE